MNKRNVLCAVVMLFSMGLVNASDGNIFKDLLKDPEKCLSDIDEDSRIFCSSGHPRKDTENLNAQVRFSKAQVLQNAEIINNQKAMQKAMEKNQKAMQEAMEKNQKAMQEAMIALVKASGKSEDPARAGKVASKGKKRRNK